MALAFQALAWERHNNVAELNWSMGYQPLIIGSLMTIQIKTNMELLIQP